MDYIKEGHVPRKATNRIPLRNKIQAQGAILY
jgi:hypothetical protein